MRRRAGAVELIGAVAKPRLRDIATDEIHVESAFGAKPIRVLTYRPITSSDPLPVIVHIHGGGFVMGAPEMKDVENRLFASELRCAIYSVDHRLAPESPHPAPVEDIYSVVSLVLSLEESMLYADRLSRARVPVELHMYPGAYHGFYRATNARVTKQAEHDNREALRRFLHG